MAIWFCSARLAWHTTAEQELLRKRRSAAGFILTAGVMQPRIAARLVCGVRQGSITVHSLVFCYLGSCPTPWLRHVGTGNIYTEFTILSSQSSYARAYWQVRLERRGNKIIPVDVRLSTAKVKKS